ncbi:MAG: hypothetical protein WBI55_00345 [Eubacteriales bacterium]|nr:hypothetical protein [Clostridiales bacterium]
MDKNTSGGASAGAGEYELLKRAKHYMDSLAAGVNPIDGAPLDSETILRDKRFIRCFSYISCVLNEKIMSYGKRTSLRPTVRQITEQKKQKKRFYLTDEQKASIPITSGHVGINTIAARINDKIDQSVMWGVSGGKLAARLVSLGYLEVTVNEEGGHVRTATELGRASGITTLERTDAVGRYYQQNVYDERMQRFIIDNINELVNNGESHSKSSSDGGDRGEQSSGSDTAGNAGINTAGENESDKSDKNDDINNTYLPYSQNQDADFDDGDIYGI